MNTLVTKIRHINLVEFLVCLGIPNIGNAMANRISFSVLNLKGLINTMENDEEFSYLSIGENIKRELKEWYHNPDHQNWLKDLAKLKLPELSLGQ